MGETIEFQSNGGTASGYLATPEAGAGPGVIVIQEWWGLVPHITDVVDRFATAGFTALAPDLYHGQQTTEPDEAGKLMMALNIEQAAKDMGGAVDALLAHQATSSSTVGVIGFCMGGGLALVLGCQRPEQVSAVAPFYGLIPWEHAQPDWSALQAKVRGHYAGDDGFFTEDAARQLEKTLQDLGKDAVLTVHPGVDHAFFNDTRPEVYDETTAQEAWAATVQFFRESIR
jgi:carboxymethylenebutenolidase